MRRECDGCGAPVDFQSEVQREERYFSAVSQADAHLTVGNWAQAVGLLSPLLQDNPGDSQLYLKLLRAATKDYSDFALEDNSMKTLAASCWSKLTRLNVFTPDMREYSRRMRSGMFGRLKKAAAVIIAWLLLAAVLMFTAAFEFSGGCEDAASFLAVGTVFCCYMALRKKPVKVFRLLWSDDSDRSNPFQTPF